MRTLEGLLGTRVEVNVAVDATAAEHEARIATEAMATKAMAAEALIVDEVVRLESVFSVFDRNSALRRYRRCGSTNIDELQTVIALAASWTARTQGVFNPFTQPLVDRWDQAEIDGRVPPRQETTTIADRVQAEPSLADLNLNAIAKGWIADAALNVVEPLPDVRAAWLSLGGDLVHVGQGSVAVGIENPLRPYDNVKPLAIVEVSNEALATSGGARRWWNIEGRRLSKVLDPRCGRPVNHIAGATVIAAHGADADVLATVAVILEPEETLALVEEAGAHCLLVTATGETLSSPSQRFRPTPTT